jgi:hypothetical protein
MNQELLTRFDAATQHLLQQLGSLSEDQLNTVPFEGSWTPGQLGDHLYKSYDVMAILNGNVQDTHRDPTEKLVEIENTFKDYTIKMDSPEPILPTTKHINKDRLLAGLKERMQPQRQAIQTLDLSKTCLDFEFPANGGTFTRHEWLEFNAIHTERHNHQLERMIHQLT